MEAMMTKTFGAADYVVFVILLLASTSIGIFFAYKDRKLKTTENYYYGGRNLKPIAVGMSLSASYMSALGVVAVPTEVYIVGSAVFIVVFGMLLGQLGALIYPLPAFRGIELRTVFEYLELRFNSWTRKFTAVLITLAMLVYASMNIFLAAMAVNAVMPLSLIWGILVTTAICTFYTALGGMKTVVWTDVLQLTTMLVGMLALFIKCLSLVGGFDGVYLALERGDRLTLFSENFDISSRTSPIGTFLSHLFNFTYLTGYTQQMLQRYQSCRSTREAQYSLLISMAFNCMIGCLAVGIGLVMYAYFDGCDPVKAGKIERQDQYVPYIAIEIFQDMPGMAGLFVATVFSAVLSTVSSILNSFSVVLLEDFIFMRWPHTSERAKTIMGKVAVAFLGVLMFALAYIVSTMKSTLLKLFLSMVSVVYGPLLGMYIMGLFLPWSNSSGAITGAIISFLFGVWTSAGALFWKTIPSLPLPPISTDLCSIGTNASDVSTTPLYPIIEPTMGVTNETVESWYGFKQKLYSVSFLYYMPITTTSTIIIGLLVSFITGANSPASMNPKLFVPLLDNRRLPARVKKFFRLGVPENKVKMSEDELLGLNHERSVKTAL